MSDMEEVYKFEIETLRKTLKECIDLIYKYGFTFEKDDRNKATTLIAMVKNQEILEEIGK